MIGLMIDHGEQSILNGLKAVYGHDLDEYWQEFKKHHPDFTDEQLLRAFESDPICNSSYFLREFNIRGLAWLISQDRQRDWKILDVGCGRGPEPYELGMRIVKNGGENFSIDAFDVSDKAIEEAKKGRFVHYCDIRSSDGEFLKKMEKVGVLHIIGETKSKIGLTDSITYQADSRVASRLAFSTHDIIDGPFLPNNKAEYDLALCNNVLQHFPAWTRELMLLHILENMKDGALLVLEHNELLYGLGMTQERVAWLKPYYDWKETLDRFGLQKEKIEPECLLLPMTVYRYDPTKNPYKGKHYAIRDKALVEIK